MKQKLLLLLGILIAFNAEASQRVRHVEVHGDQIVTIRTSIGIATIIQVPDKPNSVVVGDQESFKVEYLDQAITIKPLVTGAKSNLYIYTDWKRYNVELVSGSEISSDYVVYLESPKKVISPSKGVEVKWMKFHNLLRNEHLTLTVTRLGKTGAETCLVEFTITSKAKSEFRPDWLWLTQNGEMRPIHSLILSSLDVSPDRPVSGVFQIKTTEISANLPIRVELRRDRISYLTIPKADSWKQ